MVLRLGIAVWSALRKDAGCRDGAGTPPRSADRIQAPPPGEAGAHQRLVRSARGDRQEDSVPIERFAIIDSTLREGEQFSNAHFKIGRAHV